MLCFMLTPDNTLDKLGNYFTLKPESVGEPKLYLGARISRVDLPNGVKSMGLVV